MATKLITYNPRVHTIPKVSTSIAVSIAAQAKGQEPH